MHRGFIGCFSDLELNSESINLTRYINTTNNSITPKSGPCTTSLTSKRECACEHGGECRMHTGGSWSCDCSKTGFTGRRCEHPTYHIDLSQIHTFELNTNMQWSEQINDIAFGLQVRSHPIVDARHHQTIAARIVDLKFISLFPLGENRSRRFPRISSLSSNHAVRFDQILHPKRFVTH